MEWNSGPDHPTPSSCFTLCTHTVVGDQCSMALLRAHSSISHIIRTSGWLGLVSSSDCDYAEAQACCIDELSKHGRVSAFARFLSETRNGTRQTQDTSFCICERGRETYQAGRHYVVSLEEDSADTSSRVAGGPVQPFAAIAVSRTNQLFPTTQGLGIFSHPRPPHQTPPVA
ncbi:hypothetical protein CIB48_g9402 [Xylaria polymorpha]|nr:hypothetical protein CIB48_g9402 [Xylaria polymorpha]